jgi:two-component system response regulator DesR
MNAPIRVLLVDDQAAYRVPLVLLLGRESDFVVAAQAGTVAAAHAAIAAAGRVDVALIDLMLPDGDGDGDGVEVVRMLREAKSRTKTLVLTAVIDPAHHAQAIAAGALGIVGKAADPAEIIASVRRAHDAPVP